MPKDRVLSWLKNTGFPLEMKTTAAFKNAGFDVRQSFVYKDPEQFKGREIDVLATDPDLIGVINISFIVECKASTNPWVVLTSEDAFQNYNKILSFCISSDDAKNVMAERVFKDGKTLHFLNRPAKGGYALRQAFAKKEEDIAAYSAAISVLKAAQSFTQEQSAGNIPRLSFSFPVIVVDAPIFECSLLENGELSLSETMQSEFLFSARIPDTTSCAIKIVSSNYLSEFSLSAKKIADTLRNEFKFEEKNSL